MSDALVMIHSDYDEGGNVTSIFVGRHADGIAVAKAGFLDGDEDANLELSVVGADNVEHAVGRFYAVFVGASRRAICPDDVGILECEDGSDLKEFLLGHAAGILSDYRIGAAAARPGESNTPPNQSQLLAERVRAAVADK